jgi:hypothetical protein
MNSIVILTGKKQQRKMRRNHLLSKSQVHWLTLVPISILLFFVVLLAGCTSGLSSTETTLPVSTPSISLYITHTLTPSFSRTPNILQGIRLEIQCLDILPAFPSDLVTRGILVINDKREPNTYLRDMANGSVLELLPAASPFSVSVSPDRNWIAYETYLSDGIVVTSNDGSRYKVIKDISNQMLGWLNNEQLVFRVPVLVPTSDANPIPSQDMTEVPTLLILNPFTGERRVMEPKIPDLVPWGGKIPWWDGWSGLIYDSTLRYAAYLGENGLTLRDLENSSTIASAPFDVYSRPYWSPDGQMFAVADSLDYHKSAYEIFTMDLNGDVLQLSNLAAYHTSNYISGLVWSPNGRYIAFWLSSWDEEVEYPFNDEIINPPSSLAVLDTQTGNLTDYCIQSDTNEFSSPIWSPDSNQIIVVVDSTLDSVDDTRVVLVDLEQEIAATVTENMIPVGWLSMIP